MHDEQKPIRHCLSGTIGVNDIGADSAETTSGAPKDKSSGKASKWRWLAGGLLALVALLVLLVGTVLIAAQSERGTRALWKVTQVLSGGRVQSQWVSGSLAHGGSAQSMQIHLGTVHVDLLMYRAIGIGLCCLCIGRSIVWRRSAWTSRYCLLKKSEPLEQITMPLAFTVDNLSVPQVNLIQGLQTTELKDVSGSVSTDKVQHRINLTHLRQGDAEYWGNWRSMAKPFVLDGQIDAVLHDERNDYSAKLVAKGDFKRLNLDLSASSGAGSNQGDLTGQGNLSVQLLDGFTFTKVIWISNTSIRNCFGRVCRWPIWMWL